MNDVIPMAVVQSASYLPGKLPRHSFPQAAVTDDIIEHLATIDILEDHVVVVGMGNHLAHTADIWMME